MALAIISIVFAALALAATLRREWRDRPRISIEVDPAVLPPRAELVATILNDGYRPTTIGRIGLYWHVDRPLPGNTQAKGELLMNDPWDRIVIDAGGHHQVRWPVSPTSRVHLDTPVRGFVDYRGRRVWTEAWDVYRMIFFMGWRPDDDFPSELATAPAPPVQAQPVTRWWRIWRPRHERVARAITPTMQQLTEKIEQESR